jgi:hypothetical protein
MPGPRARSVLLVGLACWLARAIDSAYAAAAAAPSGSNAPTAQVAFTIKDLISALQAPSVDFILLTGWE